MTKQKTLTVVVTTTGRTTTVTAKGTLGDLRALLAEKERADFVIAFGGQILADDKTLLSKFAGKTLDLLPNPMGGAGLTIADFCGRVKRGESVSRLVISLGFSWTSENVKQLLSVVGARRAEGKRADLSWANLSLANLSRADLSWANLSRANLSRADLSGADLSWADLSWANLSRANLSRADLSGANLSDINACVGFSFSLECGVHLAPLLASIKASQNTKDYLTIQALARLSWEAKEGAMPYMRKWFALGGVAKTPKRRKSK